MEQVYLSQRAKCTLPFLWSSVHPSFPHQLLHVIHPSVISLYIPPSSTHSCVSTEQAGIAFNLQACIQNVLFKTMSQVTGCPHWRSLWFSSFTSDKYEHSTLILKGAIPLCMVNYLLYWYRRYTTYKISCMSQLVTLGYLFRPLPGHHQANKE